MALTMVFSLIISSILGAICGCLFSFYVNVIILFCIFSLWLIFRPYWNHVIIVYAGPFFILIWTIFMLIAWAWHSGHISV